MFFSPDIEELVVSGSVEEGECSDSCSQGHSSTASEAKDIQQRVANFSCQRGATSLLQPPRNKEPQYVLTELHSLKNRSDKFTLYRSSFIYDEL